MSGTSIHRRLVVITLALAVLLIVSARDSRQERLLRAPFAPDPDKAVTLLTTAWCGYCRAARGFLQRNGVAFTELDVEHTEAGRTLYRRVGRGGVPIIVIDGHVARGMDVEAWIRLLETNHTVSEQRPLPSAATAVPNHGHVEGPGRAHDRFKGANRIPATTTVALV